MCGQHSTIMPVSCNTESVGTTVRITNAFGELGSRRRSGGCAAAAAAAAGPPLVLDLEDSIVLTLSPRAGNKLALKYENVERIRLSPDTQSRLAELQQERPLRAILENYYTARDELENLRLNMSFLHNERQTLTHKKGLLEERLKQEQAKNESLRAYNETLRFDLSAVTTRTLELSIDKQILEDEMEKILWEGNYKFLLPLKSGSFYRKL